MKIIIVLFTILFTISSAQSLKEESFAVAQTKANLENKNILIVFTGSTWCKPCIKMEKNVLSTKEFQDFATKNLVIFELDLEMPLNMKSENYIQFEKYKKQYFVSVFPTYILTDAKGKFIKKIEGYTNLKSFIKHLTL